MRVSPRVFSGLLEHGVKPVYPEHAIRAGTKGDVTLMVQTDDTGRVIRSLAVEGDPLLVAASVEALKDFRFRPYLFTGGPLSVESQIAFRFTLMGEGDKSKASTDFTFDVPFRPEFRTRAIKEGVLVGFPRRVSGPDPLLLPELSSQSGAIYLTVTIGSDGKVKDVEVVAGATNLVGPVVAAVKQDVFEPQLVDGQAAQTTAQESYHFGSGHK
jgi:hypothetical protein